jgi:hypothetical protein
VRIGTQVQEVLRSGPRGHDRCLVSGPTASGRRHPRREAPAALQLRVQLEGAFPPVWRRVEVASDLGLDDLPAVLQVLFHWEDYHLYRFTTGPERDPGAVFECTADLAEAYDDPSLPTWDVRVDELLAAPGSGDTRPPYIVRGRRRRPVMKGDGEGAWDPAAAVLRPDLWVPHGCHNS